MLWPPLTGTFPVRRGLGDSDITWNIPFEIAILFSVKERILEDLNPPRLSFREGGQCLGLFCPEPLRSEGGIRVWDKQINLIKNVR